MTKMKTDLVFPQGNEKELADCGERLGFERLIFVYDDVNQIKKINSNLQIEYGVWVKEVNKKNLIKKIDQVKNKNFLVAVKAVDDEFDRFIIEKTRADFIFGLESIHPKDKTHYRQSGFDHILAKIAAEKDKTPVFNFKDIFKPLVLGRVEQNLKLCKKYKVQFLFGSFAEKPEEMKAAHDLNAFERLLQQKFL